MPCIFGIDFASEQFDELAGAILSHDGRDSSFRLVVTANVDHIVQLQKNPALRQAYQLSWRATIDGAPIALVARLAGAAVWHRITGADLFAKLMDGLDARQHRPAFVVSDENLARKVRDWLLNRGLCESEFAICIPSYDFESDPSAARQVLSSISACCPTHVFFGVGAPKSEIFVTRHREHFRGAIVLCVGSGIAFRFGTLRRAPAVVRMLGFEWLWRLTCEPRRLYKRYLLGGPAFLRLAALEIASFRIPSRRNLRPSDNSGGGDSKLLRPGGERRPAVTMEADAKR